MSTRKSYACDLCDGSIDPAAGTGTGVCWVGRDCIERRPITSVDHHLCGACMNGLREMLGRVGVEHRGFAERPLLNKQ